MLNSLSGAAGKFLLLAAGAFAIAIIALSPKGGCKLEMGGNFPFISIDCKDNPPTNTPVVVPTNTPIILIVTATTLPRTSLPTPTPVIVIITATQIPTIKFVTTTPKLELPTVAPPDATNVILAASCDEVISEQDMPLGTTFKLIVEPGSFHMWTAGPVTLNKEEFVGGTDRGNVLVFLPNEDGTTAIYNLTGLNRLYNWHGKYVGCSNQEQLETINARIDDQYKYSCDAPTKCSKVELGIFQGASVKRKMLTRDTYCQFININSDKPIIEELVCSD